MGILNRFKPIKKASIPGEYVYLTDSEKKQFNFRPSLIFKRN